MQPGDYPLASVLQFSRWRGEWDLNNIYVTGDGVEYQGAAYLARLSNSQTIPVEGAVWALMAEGGVATPGAPGDQGDQGATGAPGPLGPPGFDGDQGEWGLPGNQGIKGDTGIIGPPGVPGWDGDEGEIGFPGPPGTPGLRGLQGLLGPPGFDGAEGPEGFPGVQGIQGIQGAEGDAGAAGATGPQGVVGPGLLLIPDDIEVPEPLLMAGPQGPVGLAGAPGADGDDGAGVAIAASDTTYTSGTVVFTGSGGGITVQSSAQQINLSVAAPVSQTAQTANLHNVTLSGNTAGAMAHISSGTMTLAGGNNIVMSQAGNAVTISGSAFPTEKTAISGIVASNATYTSGTVSMSGFGGGITVSSNTGQRIDLSVAAPVAQSVQTQLIGGIQNSQTTYTSGTVNLVDLANITIRSTTGNKYEFSVAAPGGGGVAIAGSNTTYTSGTALFSGVGGGVTVSSNTGQRIDISVAPAGAGANQSFWHNHTGDSMSNVVPMGNSTSALAPFLLPYPMSVSYLRIPVSIGTGTGATMATSNGATGSASIMSTINVHVYSRGSGASSLSLQSYASGSAGFTQRWSISAAAGTGSNYSISYQFSYPVTGGTSSYSSTAATLLTNLNASLNSTRWSWPVFSGNRVVDIPLATTLSAGPFWIMSGVSSSTASAGSYSLMTNNRLSMAHVYMHPQSALTMMRLGEVTAGSFQMVPGIGSFSTAAGATTASLGFSNVSSSAGHPILHFGLHNSSGA